MVHFLFYAGKARSLEAAGVTNPVFEAFRAGYEQEMGDSVFSPWSAFSYEDLSSDWFGAYFGAEVFDPTSKKTLAEQLIDFFKLIGADVPTLAPNYNQLPVDDTQLRQRGKPTQTNASAKPMHTMEGLDLKR